MSDPETISADPLASLPGYVLRRAANAMMAELANRLSAIDVRISDASVLLLSAGRSDMTSSDIGRMLDIQRANMVPLVARLEDAGLVVRTPLDGKSHSLGLTPAGEAKLAEARSVIGEFEGWLVSRIPAEHRDHFKPALDALWRG